MKKLLTLAILLSTLLVPGGAGAHNGVDHSKGEEHQTTEVSPTVSNPPAVAEKQQADNTQALIYAGGVAAVIAIGGGIFLITRKKKV